jgi:hypothetical protein
MLLLLLPSSTWRSALQSRLKTAGSKLSHRSELSLPLLLDSRHARAAELIIALMTADNASTLSASAFPNPSLPLNAVTSISAAQTT